MTSRQQNANWPSEYLSLASAGSQNSEGARFLQRSMPVSATLPRTVRRGGKQASMTRLVEITLALDCVILTALFYAMWKEQRETPDSAQLPNVKSAREGGSRGLTRSNSWVGDSPSQGGPETLGYPLKVNPHRHHTTTLSGAVAVAVVLPVDRLELAVMPEGRVGWELLGASEEQPGLPSSSATSMPRPVRIREPRSLVGAAV